MMLSHRSYLVQLIKLVAQIKSVAPLHRTGNKSLFVASYHITLKAFLWK